MTLETEAGPQLTETALQLHEGYQAGVGYILTGPQLKSLELVSLTQRLKYLIVDRLDPAQIEISDSATLQYDDLNQMQLAQQLSRAATQRYRLQIGEGL